MHPLQLLLENYSILLASKSPRRKQLLEEMDIPVTVMHTNLEENVPKGMEVYKIPTYLAHQKALLALDQAGEGDLVIAADTVVILEGKALGKPSDPEEAKAMLRRLSGKTHQVITGVTLATKVMDKTFASSTEVSFEALPQDAIDYYVNTYQPLDKAGAYGIQEWIGLNYVEKIEGSYTNVVGLPTAKLLEELLNIQQVVLGKEQP